MVGTPSVVTHLTGLSQTLVGAAAGPSQLICLRHLQTQRVAVSWTALQVRRNLVVRTLEELGLTVATGQGGYFVWAEASQDVDPNAELASRWAERYGVVVRPGTPFGRPSGVRISLNVSTSKLKNAVSRLLER